MSMSGNTLRNEEGASILNFQCIRKARNMSSIEGSKRDLLMDLQKDSQLDFLKDQLKLNTLEFRKESRKEFMMDSILDLMRDLKQAFESCFEMQEKSILTLEIWT